MATPLTPLSAATLNLMSPSKSPSKSVQQAASAKATDNIPTSLLVDIENSDSPSCASVSTYSAGKQSSSPIKFELQQMEPVAVDKDENSVKASPPPEELVVETDHTVDFSSPEKTPLRDNEGLSTLR